METKDITRHVVWALVLSVGWWLITWLCGLLGSFGSYIVEIIKYAFVFGLLFYAINVKGIMHGLIAGIIYALVFIIVFILLGLLLKNPLANAEFLPFFGAADFTSMFTWPGIWLQIVAFLVFTMTIGWVNEHK